MASDFDKLFGDDWRPQDSEPEGRSARFSSEGEDRNLFDSMSLPGDPESTSETENRTPRAVTEKEVKIAGVFVEPHHQARPTYIVLLKDNRGRKIQILVGEFEAYAIKIALDGDDLTRPRTHDLFKVLMDKLGVMVERVVIDDLWSDVFYAKVGLVKSDGSTMDIDARPSDAIALAVRSRAPIYMSEAVIESVSE